MCRLIKICLLLKRKLLHWPCQATKKTIKTQSQLRDFLRCHLLSYTLNMKTPVVQRVRCILDAWTIDEEINNLILPMVTTHTYTKGLLELRWHGCVSERRTLGLLLCVPSCFAFCLVGLQVLRQVLDTHVL